MYELPTGIFIFLVLICLILTTIGLVNLIFYTGLSLFGLTKVKRNYSIAKDKTKFLFIVPAHNEELVIQASVESMLDQNYDKSLFDVVVIADNCTDKTVKLLEEYPVKVFENHSEKGEPRGKPHGIRAYIEENRDDWSTYEYVVFIDADNHVDPNYLKEVNSHLLAHPELTVIQGYLGTKNPFSSFISSGYAAVYYITNRSVQYAKYRLGMNAAIGGTGFALNVRYLIKNGWCPRSYTEDFELQVELSAKGRKTAWNHWAKVYDEKPNHVAISHNQRKRWAQGHWYVGITKTPCQLISLMKKSSFMCRLSKIETLIYSYSMIRPISYLSIGILSMIDPRLWVYFPKLFSLFPFWLALNVLNLLIIPIIYCRIEGSEEFKVKGNLFARAIYMLKLLSAFLWNGISYAIVQIIGFFTWFYPQTNWVKTAHGDPLDDHLSES